MTPVRLERVEADAAKATQGPWDGSLRAVWFGGEDATFIATADPPTVKAGRPTTRRREPEVNARSRERTKRRRQRFREMGLPLRCPVKCPCLCHDTNGECHDHPGQPCPGKYGSQL